VLDELQRWENQQPAGRLAEHVVEKLVGEAVNRLDGQARQVMQALAIYGRPVPQVAIDYLLQPYLPGVDSAPVFSRLVNMHFVHKEGSLYMLHPVDRTYALSLIERGEKSDKAEAPLFTQMALLARGADYFRSVRKPSADCKTLQDLEPQLAEIDLRIAAEDYNTAADVLRSIDLDYLLLWGHYRLMAELHERLQGKISDPELKGISAGNLGSAYYLMGRVRDAIGYYEQALAIAREQNDRKGEGKVFGFIISGTVRGAKIKEAFIVH
jgi:tetratricopeptide (TPR) repeat protein